MWTVTLVLIAATTLMACALLGGGLYEFLVVDPVLAAPTRHHPAHARGHITAAILDAHTVFAKCC